MRRSKRACRSRRAAAAVRRARVRRRRGTTPSLARRARSDSHGRDRLLVVIGARQSTAALRARGRTVPSRTAQPRRGGRDLAIVPAGPSVCSSASHNAAAPDHARDVVADVHHRGRPRRQREQSHKSSRRRTLRPAGTVEPLADIVERALADPADAVRDRVQRRQQQRSLASAAQWRQRRQRRHPRRTRRGPPGRSHARRPSHAVARRAQQSIDRVALARRSVRHS